MAIRGSGACQALQTPARSIRVLRWTFRRGDDSTVCELGLNSDDSAYELRVTSPTNPAGFPPEQFDDATVAFERQAAIERALVDDGWLLEALESEHLAR